MSKSNPMPDLADFLEAFLALFVFGVMFALAILPAALVIKWVIL